MDLRLLLAEPTEAEREAVDSVLGPAAPATNGHAAHGGHEVREQRHLLLPALRAVQRRAGWVSEGALAYVCKRLTVPPAEAYGVASFYALFALEPRPAVVAHVCTDIACMCNGGRELVAELEQRIGPAGGAASDGGSVWLESPCLGLCEHTPVALVTRAGEQPRDHAIAPASAAAIVDALSGIDPALPAVAVPQAADGGEGLRLLRRVGRVDPTSLDSYRSLGGYTALRRAIELGPAGVIREVTESKLLGRGGAAVPTGRK